MDLKTITTTPLKGFEFAFEVDFIDPNNKSMSWFNDYYLERASFDEIYGRYLLHPSVTVSKSEESVLNYLYNKNKPAMFAEMYENIGSTVLEPFAIEELVVELERNTRIPFRVVNINKPLTDRETVYSDWAIALTETGNSIRSPYYDSVSFIDYVDVLISTLRTRHFMSASGAMRIFVKTNSRDFSELNWFKALVLFDAEYTKRNLIGKGHTKYVDIDGHIIKQVHPTEVARFTDSFLSKIKKCKIELSNSKVIVELSDDVPLLSDLDGIRKWLGRIVLLLYIISNPTYLQSEYTTKLKKILTKKP